MAAQQSQPASSAFTPQQLTSLISAMPKAELHVHLEGCTTPSLARTCAERNNLPHPTHLQSLDQTQGYDFHDLSSFLAIYYPNMSVLIQPQDFHDLATDYLTKAYDAHVRHAEMFFDPQAHTARGVAFTTVLYGYASAITDFTSTHPDMSAHLIMCILRDHPVPSAQSTVESYLSLPASPAKSHILGLGLDSDERSNPPIKFLSQYQSAKAAGLNLTAHCDIDQENTLEHIHQALFDLKCQRLDHGTNIIASSEMTDYILDNGIGLTCCPISNSIVTSDFKGKEILSLLRKGVKVTVNSDDPAYFRGYANENMLKMAEGTDITARELIQLQRNAFEISWVSDQRKKELLGLLAEYEKNHLG